VDEHYGSIAASTLLLVVLSIAVVQPVLDMVRAPTSLPARLLFVSGLSNFVALQWTLKDIDVNHRTIIVRAGKGQKGCLRDDAHRFRPRG